MNAGDHEFDEEISNEFRFIKLIIGILTGYNYLNIYSIVHNRLNPSHVFLHVNFKPKIGGFGMQAIIRENITNNEFAEDLR